MTNLQHVGASTTIALADVKAMTDREQDEFIRSAALDLQEKVRNMVAGAQPKGDLAFQVTGPHQDPIQGTIWVHTLFGVFDLDALPPECEAVRIDRDGTTGDQGPREQIIVQTKAADQ